MPDDPDCAWCSAAKTLEHLWTEMRSEYYQCSCCGKQTRVDSDGVAHRERRREPAIDCQGNIIDGDY